MITTYSAYANAGHLTNIRRDGAKRVLAMRMYVDIIQNIGKQL